MSEEQVKQAAVDAPEATAPPVVEGNDAQVKGGEDDLDNLLKAYDQTTEKPAASTQPEPKTGADDDLKAELEGVKQFVHQANSIQFRQDVDKMITAVRGNLDSDLFDDVLVESWLDAQARQDPRLQKAFINRHADPKGFQKVVDGLGRKFTAKYGKMPEKQPTEDRAAVTAAVRGALTKAPEAKAPDFSGLSDAAFQAEKDKLFGT